MSIKDIWNNIINFDLTRLVPKFGEEFTYLIILALWGGFLLYMFRYNEKSWESWEGFLLSKTKAWYLRPLRWLSYILLYFIFIFIIFVPFIFIGGSLIL